MEKVEKWVFVYGDWDNYIVSDIYKSKELVCEALYDSMDTLETVRDGDPRVYKISEEYKVISNNYCLKEVF